MSHDKLIRVGTKVRGSTAKSHGPWARKLYMFVISL